MPLTCKSCLISAILLLSTLLSIAAAHAAVPLFDAHLHYNVEDSASFTPRQIVTLLRDNGVKNAVVTSRPSQLALQLHALAPELIVPFLGVYRFPANKRLWLHNKKLPAKVEKELASAAWQGIGELHIFAPDRHNPVFLRLVEIAASRDLPLMMHCDPAVIDALFRHAPQARVIWAHAGAYPFTPVLRDYLERYPNLYVDLSVREERIAPEGELLPDWELLLSEYADRFLVGVDTYRTSRWEQYPVVAGKIRNWLNQLPDEVAKSIASGNGERLFGQAVDLNSQ